MSKIDPRILSVLQKIKKEIDISIPDFAGELYCEKSNLENELNNLKEEYADEDGVYPDYVVDKRYEIVEKLDFFKRVFKFSENVNEVYQIKIAHFKEEEVRILKKIEYDHIGSNLLILVDDSIIVASKLFEDLYNKLFANQEIILPANKKVLNEIYNLLNEYSYKFDFAIKDVEIEVRHPIFDNNMNNLMKKLRAEDVIIFYNWEIDTMDDPANWILYRITKGINFDNYCNAISNKIEEIQKREGILNSFEIDKITKKDTRENQNEELVNQPQDIIFHLSYKSGKLILNDYLLIHTCQLSSINDRLLKFLFNDINQNRLIDREELEKNNVFKEDSNRSTGKETKSVFQCFDDVNIRENLRKWFVLEISTHSVNFRSKITKKDTEELGIKFIDLKELFKINKK